MRPVQLNLDGFASFREPTAIDFGEADYFALVGPTGSGKSTILDAIVFALYGTVPRWGRRDAIADALAPTANRCTVSLVFDVAGQRYQVAREVRRNGATPQQRNVSLVRFHDPTSASADVDTSEVLAGEIKELRDTVIALLGLTYENFCQCVVLPQGQFARFLTAPAADRQSILLTLLGAHQYEGIGRQAGTMAETRGQTVDLLSGQQSELADATPEAVRELVRRREALTSLEAELVRIRPTLTAAGTTISDLDTRIATIDHQVALLTDAAAPDDVSAIQERLLTATTTLTTAEQARRRASDRYRDAVQAAGQALSPDAVARWTATYAEHAQAVRTAEASRAEAAESASALNAAADVLEEARVAERSAAVALETARSQESSARDHSTERARQLDLIRRGQAEVETLTEHLSRRDRAVDQIGAMQPRITALAETLTQRESDITAAQDRWDRAQTRAEAALLRPHLELGHECPVCAQPVAILPPALADPALEAAREELDRAQRAASAARDALSAARDELATHQQQANHIDQTIDAQWARLTREVPGLPDDREGIADWIADRLHMLTTDSEAAAATLLTQTEALSRAQEQHRVSAEILDQVRNHHATAALEHERATTSARALAERVAQLRTTLAEAPAAEDLPGLLATADRLAAERAAAEAEATAADDAVEQTRLDHDDAVRAARAARVGLDQVRDQLAVLGPPALESDDLPTAWDQLLAWTRDCHDRLTAEGRRVKAERATVIAERDRVTDTVHARVAAIIDLEQPVPLDDLVRIVTARTERARAEVDRLTERQGRRQDLRDQIARATEEQQVAGHLRQLLRSNRFPQWLADTALDSLVVTASHTLRQLSNDQFDLTHDKGEFAVIDHSDADSVRSVRTLSGGETFQASLALALALADQLAGMAGAVKLESMFLDEGFGTLDPESLEVVAATLENLASGDRTVGVVTHVQALAERVPVRFQVRRDNRTSSVTREAW